MLCTSLLLLAPRPPHYFVCILDTACSLYQNVFACASPFFAEIPLFEVFLLDFLLWFLLECQWWFWKGSVVGFHARIPCQGSRQGFEISFCHRQGVLSFSAPSLASYRLFCNFAGVGGTSFPVGTAHFAVSLIWAVRLFPRLPPAYRHQRPAGQGQVSEHQGNE